jgi:hypothetical protein
MRPEVDGEMLDDGGFKCEKGIGGFVEERLEIAEPEAHALGDGLGGISGIEDSVCGCFGEEVDHGVRQILHLVDHDVVDFWAIVAFEPEEVQDVVDRVHDIVAPAFYLPPFVLAEGFVDVEFLLFREEGVGGET